MSADVFVASGVVTDVLMVDDEALCLTTEQLFRMGPIAATVVHACRTPHTLTELAAICEAEFGAPPGADVVAALSDQLDQLVGRGLLERRASDEVA